MKALSPTVMVIDDEESVRSSLRYLFESIRLPVLVYSSANEFLLQYTPDQPGCVLLDVRMPDMSGLELQQQLNVRGAMIPVIFITGHGDITMAVEAMQHGAFDFVPKPFRNQDLIDRVHRALKQDAVNRSQIGSGKRVQQRLETLTARELEVLELVTRGKPNKVMAAELKVSLRTVEIHRAHVMEKMQANSLAHLVRMTLELDRTVKRA